MINILQYTIRDEFSRTLSVDTYSTNETVAHLAPIK